MPIQKGTWLTYVSCIYAGLYQHIHQCRSPATKANVRIGLYVRRPFHPSLSQLSRASKGKHDELNCKHEEVSCHDSEHYCSGGDVPPGNRACRCNEPWSSQKGVLEASIRMDDTQVKFWTKLCKEGQPTEAVKALDLLVHRGFHVDNSVFYGIIQKCMTQKDLALGRRVHALAVISGYESNPFVANHIICMYSSHGKLQEAMRVFGQVEVPNRYMWASIILAHARHGDSREAVRLYRLVRKSTLRPNNRIFVAALKACAIAKDLSCGRDVHADILDSQGEPDMFVHNCLVDMYAKCGRLEDARKVFDVMQNKDVVTWTAMIAAYVQHGFGKEALTLYSDMQKKCPTPVNHVTVACLVQACGLIGATYEGKQLHSMVQDRGLEVDTVLGSSFISMYAKCGDLENARSVFDNLRSKDVKTWNAMITGYVQNARAQEAFVLYFRMQSLESCSPDSVTFVSLLQACGHLGGLEQGKTVHHAILHSRVQLTDLFVANALIEMYSKCGSLEDACGVFDSLATKDLAIWTAMISAYTQQGFGHKAINLYTEMQHQGINATDAVVFVCLLQACASARALHWGKKLHAEICERGLETDEDISNCLVNMYAKCGSLEDAHHLFDHLERKSIGTYNGLIAGYVQYGFRQEALAVYGQMQQGSAMSADANTFVCLLQACASLGFENEAKQIHAQIRQRGLESDIMVGNSLVHMYAKIGSITDARRVFDSLPHRDVVTWNTLISGYTQHGLSHEALLLYENMTHEGLVPGNNVTFACLLQACASIGAVDQGKNLHLVIQQVGLGADAAVANSLVNIWMCSAWTWT